MASNGLLGEEPVMWDDFCELDFDLEGPIEYSKQISSKDAPVTVNNNNNEHYDNLYDFDSLSDIDISTETTSIKNDTFLNIASTNDDSNNMTSHLTRNNTVKKTAYQECQPVDDINNGFGGFYTSIASKSTEKIRSKQKRLRGSRTPAKKYSARTIYSNLHHQHRKNHYLDNNFTITIPNNDIVNKEIDQFTSPDAEEDSMLVDNDTNDMIEFKRREEKGVGKQNTFVNTLNEDNNNMPHYYFNQEHGYFTVNTIGSSLTTAQLLNAHTSDKYLSYEPLPQYATTRSRLPSQDPIESNYNSNHYLEANEEDRFIAEKPISFLGQSVHRQAKQNYELRGLVAMRSQNIDSLFNEPNIYQNDRISGATVPKSPISNMKQYWHKRQHPSIDRYYFEQDKERVIPGVSFDNNMEFGSNSNNNSSTMYQTLQSNPQFTVKGLEITKPFTDKKDKQRRSPIKRCKSNDSWVLEQEEYSADDSMPYGSFIGTNKALQQKSTENNDLKEIKNENNCTLRNLPVIDKDELWSDQEPEPGWSSTSHIEAWQTKIDEAENNEQSLWLSEVTVNRRSKSRKTLNTSNTSLSTTTAHSLDPRSIMVNFNYDLDYSLASSDGNEDSCNDSTTNQEDTPIVTPETYTSINPDGSLTSKSCQPDQERETFDFLFY